VLELRDLVKHYEDGTREPVRAVDGVSLTIESGNLVALYGPSGSGKTTLLNLIAGVVPPDSGSIWVAGRNVCEMSRKEGDHYRLHQVGLVGQHDHLIRGATAIKNANVRLLFAGELKTKPIEPLLERLGLADCLNRKMHELSSGQRQRVMIAAALSTDPELILADEPTGSLDTERTQMVLSLLRELCRERDVAILIATHDPQAALFADQVYQLRDGRLGEYTPPAVVPLPSAAQDQR
jgi:putative ABC transport system ATP-binding protein